MLGKKTAEDTLQTAKLLMDHGLRDLINEADSLGNTPLHVLIARYALEERKLAHSNSKSYGYHDDHQVLPLHNQMLNSSNMLKEIYFFNERHRHLSENPQYVFCYILSPR